MTKRAQGFRSSRRLLAVAPALAAGALVLAACGNGEVATSEGIGSEAEPGTGPLPAVFTPAPQAVADEAQAESSPGEQGGVTVETVVEADLRDDQGVPVGSATFLPSGQAMQITVQTDGIDPGEHTVLLTDSGVCSAADDFESAGSALQIDGTEVGDLAALTVDADGTGTLTTNTTVPVDIADLTDGAGSALVLVDADDVRVACGVVEQA